MSMVLKMPLRYFLIKIHGSESQGQGGSSKRHPIELKTHSYVHVRDKCFKNQIVHN